MVNNKYVIYLSDSFLLGKGTRPTTHGTRPTNWGTGGKLNRKIEEVDLEVGEWNVENILECMLNSTSRSHW